MNESSGKGRRVFLAVYYNWLLLNKVQLAVRRQQKQGREEDRYVGGS
jgi:hypothetical protein